MPRLLRPPPGVPPPGLPPPPGSMQSLTVNPNVLSAPPSIMRPRQKQVEEETTATIQAKPQIKNVMGEITRFMPTALRVKREMKDSTGRVIKSTGK